MIEAKEIRLGNWVKIRGEYEVQVINLIGKEWFSYQEQNACDWKDTEGIPLTPEILLAVGFEKINSNVPNLHRLPFDKYKQLRWSTIDGLCVETIKSGWLWQFEHIKYLHQLQNLYYSLTGKELTYSPNTK